MRDHLMSDWNQQVYARSSFLVNLFKRAATRSLRKHRDGLSGGAALPVGDILLYQARGSEVREFIRDKIQKAAPPVTVVAHSLGGIACVDLLALPNPPGVHRLVTAGSQSPLLYEIGALFSLKPPAPLPQGFPPWLNFYDRNDFLSYVAERLWGKCAVNDFEIESGDPFPDSHSAYFANQVVWNKIRKFIDGDK
jgi:pimeloyl-ACP methyl ester carboxylesterase